MSQGKLLLASFCHGLGIGEEFSYRVSIPDNREIFLLRLPALVQQNGGELPYMGTAVRNRVCADSIVERKRHHGSFPEGKFPSSAAETVQNSPMKKNFSSGRGERKPLYKI
ncbi:hypothetical protein CDAR_237901 [Caerostris darwini]|uniref:Uncharacterized protein n=1 Tax=Caerostris darwini TaxID=1538125 RepID=A0AAV4S286_9ARAC|nr:hypothetical protein CDAR_237901 [Caerostris darwini]